MEQKLAWKKWKIIGMKSSVHKVENDMRVHL